jgi:hypothetical protein
VRRLMIAGQDLFLLDGPAKMKCVRWSATVQPDGGLELSVQALSARCSRLEASFLTSTWVLCAL